MAERENWSREENELVVADYLTMLADELGGRPYIKRAHNRSLQPLLNNRSIGSIEWKKENISAVLIQLGCPYIAGYKPADRIQRSLADVVRLQLASNSQLHALMLEDADRPVAFPAIPEPNLLDMLRPTPQRSSDDDERIAENGAPPRIPYVRPNYLERESRNAALGVAGERLVLDYERARLSKLGRKDLAGQIEHVADTRGDGDGFDILSFEDNGEERFIEVKTTRYGQYTPFFISRNELRVSRRTPEKYHLYRLYEFTKRPLFFQLCGDLADVCRLNATTYQARAR
jgi:hypothetical protein